MDHRHSDNRTKVDTAVLPTSVAELRRLVLEQQSLFIDQLLEQIRLARHQHFGTRSERFSIDQMALAFKEAEAAAERSDPDAELPQATSADEIEALLPVPNDGEDSGRVS